MECLPQCSLLYEHSESGICFPYPLDKYYRFLLWRNQSVPKKTPMDTILAGKQIHSR